MAELSDSTLLGQYADYQTESAFSELVRRHVNFVYSVAFRWVRNTQDAQDVVQAVFTILARKAADLRRRASLTGWLYETTRLTSRQLLRTRARQLARDQEAYMQSTLEPTDDDSLWPQLAPHLEEAMSRLSVADRELMALRFYENKSGPETAAVLGIGAEATYKRTARALSKLQKFFERRGIKSTSAILAGTISANSVHAAPVGMANAISAVALTKGAAASASTLTLIKGALKIMAWSKMKTAVVTAAIVILAGITAVSVENHLHGSASKQSGKQKLPTGNVQPMVGYGYSRYAIVLASDGSLWSWGEEYLGWPVLGHKNNKVENSVSLRRIGNKNDWRSIAVGGSQCLAIKSDGTLWGWGENLNYQLGDGTKITRPTLVPSIHGNDWKQAATEGGNSFAIKNDGTLWAWGNNWAGQLGTGDLKSQTNAVQVGTSTNWKRVVAGSGQTVGLQTDGTLWFWGSFTGDSSDQHKLRVPTRMSSETNWVDACFGYFTVLALKADGTL
jgi:RNA polymerase sigma factor (sigma-70 family)